MAFPQSRLQRGYVQKEASWGVIPNSGGTASLANGDAFLCETLDMNYDQPTAKRPDKTGSLGQVVGTPTRITSNWSTRFSLAGSGTAGTACDTDPFFEALLGKKTVNSGTSVVYDPDDVNPSLTIYDFNGLATAAQRAIFGSIVNQGVFRLGDTFAMAELSGEGRYVIDTDQFATAATALKGGLSAFPSEPASPSTSGSSVAGYKGIITLDGNTYTTFRSGDITIACARSTDKQVFNDDLPGAPSAGERTVTIDLTMRDDDTSNFKALKNKAHSKTAVDLTLQIGKTAGNIWTFLLKNVLLGTPQYDVSQAERIVNFRGSTAHMTSLSSKDDVKITLT